jgi:thiamine-monophosphate kinase
MAAASDLAAMGARPRALLAALVLPEGFSDDDLGALARGQAEAAAELGTAIVGGNLARGGELSVTTTALGEADRPLTRAGARPGDDVLVAGPLGLARAGLAALLAGDASAATEAARAAWRRPLARIEAGLRARDAATAAIDVSDGLALDAARLADASELRVVLDEAELRAALDPALVTAAAALEGDPLDLAAFGGEDYALVVTVPEGTRIEGFARIGRCEFGAGVVLATALGELRAVPPRGFDHFA